MCMHVLFQWDSSAVAPSYYSEGKTEKKTPVSVSPMRMFPTWAMSPPQPPAPPPAVRSLEASPAVSSNASRSARPRLRANLAQPMEGPALQITNTRNTEDVRARKRRCRHQSKACEKLFMLYTDCPQTLGGNVIQTILYPGSQPCFGVLLPGTSSFTYDYSFSGWKTPLNVENKRIWPFMDALLI